MLLFEVQMNKQVFDFKRVSKYMLE